MGKRWSRKTQHYAYQFLIYRDGGEFCQHCGVGPPPDRRLDIDHINNNRDDFADSNLHLLCRICNVVKENKWRKECRRARASRLRHSSNGTGTNNEHNPSDLVSERERWTTDVTAHGLG